MAHTGHDGYVQAHMEEEMNLQHVGTYRGTRPVGERRRASTANRFDVMTAARTDACLLLTGPTREVRDLAYLIHKVSGWGDGPFRVVDCGRPEAELQQYLFASVTGPGIEEHDVPHARPAQDGTVFLQDVGRLSLTLQRQLATLLEHLRGRSGTRLRRRIMACNPSPLLPCVMAGTFDDALFYRLNVIHLAVGR